MRTEDIEKLDGTIDAERLMLVATDGPTGYMRPVIDSMDDDTFALYMRYHFAVCERSDLIGASHHTLDILKKDNRQCISPPFSAFCSASY